MAERVLDQRLQEEAGHECALRVVARLDDELGASLEADVLDGDVCGEGVELAPDDTVQLVTM